VNNINILDCTLRDGGYINDWKFGEKNIIKIIKYLSESKVDIIECGFLKDQEGLDFDSSIFDEVDRIHRMIPNNKNSLYVAMVNVGEYDPKYLSYKFETKLDGIRIAFHKKDKDSAFKLAKEIAKKRYKVFLQPMVSLSYTDKEFIDLIEEANKLSKEINLFAFYIVDSFGAMKQTDLLRLYHLVDNNLNENIYIGYHAHNNSQLAFSNAQSLVELRTKRKLIIDSSIYGMGRGAGNLNTELFIDYLNEIKNSNYTNIPILKIIDEILFNIYLTNPWGYSLPHYLSANNNCHPNYATYLNNKNTLTIEDMSNIISQIKEEKKNNFDKAIY
jgi:4-hydroxy 2-oxovalerate aldolase